MSKFNNLPTEANNVDFCWSFEDQGCMIDRICTIEVDGGEVRGFFEEIENQMLVGKARKIAQAYAKSTNAVFLDYTDDSTAKDYRIAQMECNQRNR